MAITNPFIANTSILAPEDEFGSSNKLYTPERSKLEKQQKGLSDTKIEAGVYKFMGCDVLSANMTLGFNSTASSLSLNLVEDGKVWTEPAIPSLWAFSLPKGGPGEKIIYSGTGIDLDPDRYYPQNVPFYFSGICTNFSKSQREIGGKIISLSLIDPREILSGIQCLLNGFSLSQNIGAGSRFTGVKNVIDVFGYWYFGMESEKNEYGMPWDKVKEVIENVRVTIHGISFEFKFEGDAFNAAPSWYRIDHDIIDLVSLCQKVAHDSGSDFIFYARKTSTTECVVEIRAISRKESDPLTKQEIKKFIASRSNVVESAKVGKEYRNEPTSNVVIGGFKNLNYVAFPTEYNEDIHLDPDTKKEDYNAFPSDIKVRLFGGLQEMTVVDKLGNPIQKQIKGFDHKSGSIFPFWGFTPDDHAWPLIEPFISLDHLVFDKNSTQYAGLKRRIPSCYILVEPFQVRVVQHNKAFIDGDQDSDFRPFAYLDSYVLNAEVSAAGTVKGLPLNTEVLRAALVSEYAFWSLYSLYYPDITVLLGVPLPNFDGMKKFVDNAIVQGKKPDLFGYPIEQNMVSFPNSSKKEQALQRDGNGKVVKTIWNSVNAETKEYLLLSSFRTVIYEQVRQYALDCMGKKFLVCLPRSIIMERIWMNLPVPTNPLKPQIEYVVDQRGFWEYIPFELNGLVNPIDTGDPVLNAALQNIGLTDSSPFNPEEEEQIRRKFMVEDGRFLPMVAIEWQPKGNINFNSNGKNKAMFQDIPTSEFRPNKIASRNPSYIFSSANMSQLVKRPDLALIELPSAITFDPFPEVSAFSNIDLISTYFDNATDHEFIATRSGIVNYFWYFLLKNDTLRDAMKSSATALNQNFEKYAYTVFKEWANKLYKLQSLPFRFTHSTEMVMDLKGVIVPLTSTWVTYGPWYANYDQAQGMVGIDVDESLVPWNFDRPPITESWDINLNDAGQEKLRNSISNIDYVDNASIVVAGFPEYGPADALGSNSNLTAISIDFGIGGIKTTYQLSTYAAKPGTYRKVDYDNLAKGRFDSKERLPEVINNNLIYNAFAPPYSVNRFQE